MCESQNHIRRFFRDYFAKRRIAQVYRCWELLWESLDRNSSRVIFVLKKLFNEIVEAFALDFYQNLCLRNGRYISLDAKVARIRDSVNSIGKPRSRKPRNWILINSRLLVSSVERFNWKFYTGRLASFSLQSGQMFAKIAQTSSFVSVYMYYWLIGCIEFFSRLWIVSEKIICFNCF